MGPSPDHLERIAALGVHDTVLLDEARLIDALAEATGALRRRATEVLAELAGLPEQRALLERARTEAAARVASAERSLEAARAALESAAHARRDREERLAEAQADERAASQRLADARRHAEWLEARSTALEERERELRAESEQLLASAHELAGEVSAAPRVAGPVVDDVPASLAQLDDWGVKARAALFVARGSIEAERERVLAEANALGSAAIGEDLGALAVPLVLQRVRAAVPG